MSEVEFVVTCVHYWQCEPPDDSGYTYGRCKFCGTERVFPPSIQLGEPKRQTNYNPIGTRRETKYDKKRDQIVADYLSLGFNRTMAKHGMAASTLDDKLRLWKIKTGPKKRGPKPKNGG